MSAQIPRRAGRCSRNRPRSPARGAACAVTISVFESPTMIACCGSPPARSIVAISARGSGLQNGNVFCTADRAEARGEAELCQQPDRGMLELVGADGEGPSRRLEPVERRFDAGKGAALVGDMRLVTGKKREEHFLEPRRRDAARRQPRARIRSGRARRHRHGPRRLERQWREPLLGEDMI